MKLFNLFEDPRFSSLNFDDKESDAQEAEFKKDILKQIHAVSFMIKKQCQPWLKQRISQPVYRGFRTASSEKIAFIRKVRHDRRPKDSDQKLHDMFDFVIDQLGLTANRHNSMFTSGSLQVAASYGSPYVLYPTGNFSYTWSETMRDWYSHNNDFLGQLLLGTMERQKNLKNEYVKKNPDLMNALIKLKKQKVDIQKTSYESDQSWASKEMVKRSRARYEEERTKPLYKYLDTLVHGSGYDLIIGYPELRPYVMQPIKVANRELQIRGDDNSLNDAIKSNHEVMIHCDSIICVHLSIYPIIQKFLQGMSFQQVYNELDMSKLGNFTSS